MGVLLSNALAYYIIIGVLFNAYVGIFANLSLEKGLSHAVNSSAKPSDAEQHTSPSGIVIMWCLPDGMGNWSQMIIGM